MAFGEADMERSLSDEKFLENLAAPMGAERIGRLKSAESLGVAIWLQRPFALPCRHKCETTAGARGAAC